MLLSYHAVIMLASILRSECYVRRISNYPHILAAQRESLVLNASLSNNTVFIYVTLYDYL